MSSVKIIMNTGTAVVLSAQLDTHCTQCCDAEPTAEPQMNHHLVGLGTYDLTRQRMVAQMAEIQEVLDRHILVHPNSSEQFTLELTDSELTLVSQVIGSYFDIHGPDFLDDASAEMEILRLTIANTQQLLRTHVGQVLLARV